MAKFVWNGQEFTGTTFAIEKNVLIIDGHPVMDMNPKTEAIELSGDGTLFCDKKVVIYGTFNGTINGQEIIINGESNGNMTANKIVKNV